jgi:RHS repeat-associated protein
VFGYKGGYRMPVGNHWLLMHFGQRYYDPTTGSWTQQDPAAQGAGFLFAGDDPMNASDPTGLESIEQYGAHSAIDCVRGGAIAGVAGAETGPFDLVAAGGGCIAGAGVATVQYDVGELGGEIAEAGDDVATAYDAAENFFS